MCAAANVMLALTHLFLWSKEHRDSVYLVSALMAAGAVGVTLAELSLLKAQTIEGFARGLIWSNVFVFVLLISMVWYIFLRFGTARRWLALLITAFWTAAIVLNFLSPASLITQCLRVRNVKTTP